jgi:hypothetical protein
MKKIKYFMFVLSLISAVGFVTAISALRNIPESFDWDLEEEVEDE